MRALTKITSTIASKDDSSFLKGIFKTPTPKQRSCVIMQTEVYVKKLLTYQRGTVFGKAATLLVPLYLQTQLLGIMINNFHGGLTFVDKMIPATKITANNYLYDTMDLSVRQIEEAGGVVEAMICDGNRINQAFLSKFHKVPEKPWLTSDEFFFVIWLCSSFEEYSKFVANRENWTIRIWA